ncbi:MAG: malto-oligosyltrehalose trehalohydrolase [Gemmatimonadota bacterium]
MSAAWSLERGAGVVPGGVRFSVWAPAAERVDVRLRCGRAAGEHRLEPRPRGVFEGTVAGAGAGDDYLFRLDGGPELPDPVSRHQPAGVHGPSRVVDPAAFAWSDGEWRGRETAELVLYELHVGTFTAAGTFRAAAERLPALRELGVTAVELMPVAQFPGARNWGYDGVFPYAPQSTYGGPEGLRRLVDAAHAIDLAVILDVVYSHLGPEGNVLERYGPYFTDRYRTPWGRAVNFDAAGSDEVRRYVLDNARYWIAELHVDGLRLDAVHAIYDFSARHLLEELAAAVHGLGESLGRRTLVIAESDLNDPRLLRPAELGGHGLDAQWSDEFHHAVHAALTGESAGYYRDFGGVEPLREALQERFVGAGRHSEHRRRRHGAPARDVPADRFVVCVQNHDQVGNRAHGERLAALLPFEARKLAAALLLLSPYVPLLFMGEEYGETNPFLYFVSHGDPALVEAVRDGRRREFAAFAWRGEIPDPQAEETFERSRIDPDQAARPGHAELLRLYRDLLGLRGAEPALRPGRAEVSVEADDAAGWVSLALLPEPAVGPAEGARPRLATALAAAFNLADRPNRAALPAAPSAAGAWTSVLWTWDERYGGGGPAPRSRDGTGTPAHVELPRLGAVLLRREDV